MVSQDVENLLRRLSIYAEDRDRKRMLGTNPAAEDIGNMAKMAKLCIKSIDQKSIDLKIKKFIEAERRTLADQIYEDVDLGDVESCTGWETCSGTNIWTRKVFVTDSSESKAKSLVLQFRANSCHIEQITLDGESVGLVETTERSHA